jgi:hypothetical protein
MYNSHMSQVNTQANNIQIGTYNFSATNFLPYVQYPNLDYIDKMTTCTDKITLAHMATNMFFII